jgi:hypothetical protein
MFVSCQLMGSLSVWVKHEIHMHKSTPSALRYVLISSDLVQFYTKFESIRKNRSSIK